MNNMHIRGFIKHLRQIGTSLQKLCSERIFIQNMVKILAKALSLMDRDKESHFIYVSTVKQDNNNHPAFFVHM